MQKTDQAVHTAKHPRRINSNLLRMRERQLNGLPNLLFLWIHSTDVLVWHIQFLCHSIAIDESASGGRMSTRAFECRCKVTDDEGLSNSPKSTEFWQRNWNLLLIQQYQYVGRLVRGMTRGTDWIRLTSSWARISSRFRFGCSSLM